MIVNNPLDPLPFMSQWSHAHRKLLRETGIQCDIKLKYIKHTNIFEGKMNRLLCTEFRLH